MKTSWIIIIAGIVGVIIIGVLLLGGEGETKTTTSTSTTTSNETNGLLGAIADIWGGIGGAFSGGNSGSGETPPTSS